MKIAVYIYDTFLIGLFLFLVGILSYQAYLILHGILFILTMIFFAAIFIYTVYVLISKSMLCIECRTSKPLIVWNVFMTTVSSAISLYTSHLFMQDLRIYGEGVWDMITFAFGAFFGFLIWCYTMVGWLEAIDSKNPAFFNYKGFLKELIAAGIFYALVNF